MTKVRSPKKSDVLEVRLAHATKQAFMAHCQAQGRSASEAVRGFVDAQLAPAARAPKRRMRYVAVCGLTVAALGAMAAPSLARPAAAAQFEALDVDHDGAVSGVEWMRLDRNHDGRISLQEFTAARARSDRS